MKIAALYSGRSLSQPVLLNQLNERLDIELHLFRSNIKEDIQINFEHNKKIINFDGIRIQNKQPLWINKYLFRKKSKSYLQSHLDRSFDLVITMNDFGPPAVDVADSYDIPSLFFIRNLNSPGQEMYNPSRTHIQNLRSTDFGGAVQYPFLVDNFRSYKTGLEHATKPIANSEYVASRLKADFGVSSEVIYPPITLDKYRVDYDRDGYIGMVGPRNYDKGADIFFDIVESMPSEEFISAGLFRHQELKERAESLGNLHHMGYVEDMRDFYRQTKLVIVPSRWNEAFGRAAVEPMVSGIPCVVSNCGALPEVVGDAGEIVSDIESTNAWIEAINRSLNNIDSERKIKRSKKFSTSNQTEKLINVINEIVM